MTTLTEPAATILPAHQPEIEALRARYGHILSSHAFASLYLWRDQMKLSLLLREDCFSVLCRWRGENTWFFPCGSESGKAAFLREHCTQPNFRLCYLGAADAEFLQTRFAGKFVLTRDENADEYIYSRAEHLTLKGGRYANVRTQLHRAERSHTLKTLPLCDETARDAVGIVRDWASRPHPFSCGLSDDKVDEEAISEHNMLGLTGVVVYDGAQPCGVCAGFPLTDDTFDVCVAKCRRNLPGLSYYVKRALFQALDERFTYINMEEDLGMPGLREMKQILAPVRENEIWEARQL